MRRSTSLTVVAGIATAISAFTTTAAGAAAESGPILWYRQPAKLWASEALPIGNGRLGAMLFGGVGSERIQFNEISLWGGANNWDGGYNTGDTGFGGYRNFGDILIRWNGAPAPELTSPSGHAAGNGQSLENTADGNPDTKWCIENPGAAVIWQAELPKASQVTSYSLTSAPDVPARDPRAWRLEGAPDGKSWTLLDERALAQPFESRGQSKSFPITSPAPFRFYRLTFSPPAGASHFQVAEIALEGIKLAATSTTEAIPSDYRRALDIRAGIHRVSFTSAEGARISREAFASRPDQVIVMRYKADKPGALTGSIQLKPGQGGAVQTADTTGISFSGSLANHLKYACTLRVLHQGGTVRSENASLSFQHCNELTLLLNARTDYKPSHADGWRGPDPAPIIREELAAAAAKGPDAIKRDHLTDMTGLLGRVSLDLGRSLPELAALPTDERIKRCVDEGRFQQGGNDPELEVMLFQMGRYLLASSSRPGGLPANLQGLWNDRNDPAWASDYHNNINIQMNYWPAEATGLGDCAGPLIDFVRAQAEPCRIATRKAFGGKTRGWTARTSQSPFGGNGWEWNIPASAWYALHLFDHWDFGRDDRYLREQAYPVLKEVCEYWEDRLKPLPDGTLVAPDGWSPEHGPREDGVMHDQQLIWELFDDYLKAAKALGVDPDYQATVAAMQTRLAPNKIGKWGQLQEWQTDRDDPNDRHRHTSHLFALFPGRQITVSGTPDLARAARVSLLARSSDTADRDGRPWTPANMHRESVYGWVWAWRAAMWARLGDAERAHALVWGKLGNTAPNMLGLNLPYFANRQELIQLDSSFGITAAMAEMLMQSHADEIHLLPALPKAWANGSCQGLRARGGFTVDLAWKDGRVTRYRVASHEPRTVKLRIHGRLQTIEAERMIP